MNQHEFFRQGKFLRDYTPVLSTPAGTMTITNKVVSYAKFFVLGRLVVGIVKISFDLGGVAEFAVVMTAPTTIKSGSIPAFSGFVDVSVGGYATAGGSFATDKISLLRYDSGVWNLSPGSRFITGVFFYENGE